MSNESTRGNGGPPVTIVEINRESTDSRNNNQSDTGANRDDNASSAGESIDGIRLHDPASGSDGDAAPFGYRADGTPAKKRGRKPGVGNGQRPSGKSAGKSPAQDRQSVDGLGKLLFSLHAMAAIKFQVPELAIDNNEGKLIASAIADVQAHYNWDVSPDVQIWVNLVTAMGAVYGPRAVSIYVRKKQAKTVKRPEPTIVKKEGTVTPIFDIPGMHSPTS